MNVKNKNYKMDNSYFSNSPNDLSEINKTTSKFKGTRIKLDKLEEITFKKQGSQLKLLSKQISPKIFHQKQSTDRINTMELNEKPDQSNEKEFLDDNLDIFEEINSYKINLSEMMSKYEKVFQSQFDFHIQHIKNYIVKLFFK